MPPAISLVDVYCTEADIEAMLSVTSKEARVDDNNDASMSAVEQGYITMAIPWATDRCNFYLATRYCPDDLAESWMVNQWAVICACYYLSIRRGNPPPGSFDDLYKDAREDMKLVHAGEYEVPLTATRETSIPAWSNVCVDMGYELRKIRVQRPISERTLPPYRQNQDHRSNFIVEP